MDSERLAEVCAGKVGAALLDAATNLARAHAGRPIEHLTTVAVVLRPDGTARVAVLEADLVDDVEVLLEYVRRVQADDVDGNVGATSAELAVITRLRGIAPPPVDPGHERPVAPVDEPDTSTLDSADADESTPATADASLVDDERALLDDAMDDTAR